MNRNDVEETVISILNIVLKCDVNSSATRENMPKWDSLKHIEIVFAVEDELNIQFPENDIAELNSVENIVDKALGLLNAA